MKVTTCFLVFWGLAAALPSHLSSRNKIKGENLYVEPIISNYTADIERKGRIIGGTEVSPHSRAYQAALIINGETFCSGSLISPNYVLTAAHCTFRASYVEIRLGAHYVNIEEHSQLRVTSTNIIIHEDYMRPDRHSNDISLIQTPEHIVTNNYIQIVRLAVADSGDYSGYVAFLSGWGTTSNSSTDLSAALQETHLFIMQNVLCLNVYGPDVVKSSTLCTYGYTPTGPCNGDSGGPLVVGNTQVGVVSFIPSRGCESGYPSGYSRISYYRSWINRNTDL